MLAERLKRGDLDLILISLPFEAPGIITHPLYDEHFVVLLPTSHPWQARPSISIDDLAEENILLLGPGHCFRDQVLKACPRCLQTETARGGLQQRFEGGSLETIRCMVASGVGITVLPCTASSEAPFFARNILYVRPFASEPPARRSTPAWRRSFPRTAAVDVVAEAVRAAELRCVAYL